MMQNTDFDGSGVAVLGSLGPERNVRSEAIVQG